MQRALQVTKVKLPPLDEYVKYLTRIWDANWVTNNGPMVQELERCLRNALASEHVSFVTNGTMALQLALRAANVTGEVITTPFSYVATVDAILWERCTPVFVDVEPHTLTIDPDSVTAAITDRTTAILATHVYGFPCDVDRLEGIARAHGLKLIYDAAHAFGCELRGRPLASFGDVSCLSFHATKVFHTIEGGAVVVNGDDVLAERVRLMRAFGQSGDQFECVGINGKNSELHAAMGLCNLPLVAGTIAQRRTQFYTYKASLVHPNIRVLEPRAGAFRHNYGYCPVVLPSESITLNVLNRLSRRQIFPRRYFYPALNGLRFVDRRRCAIAEDIAPRVICLPLSEAVTPSDQAIISEVILEAVEPRRHVAGN